MVRAAGTSNTFYAQRTTGVVNRCILGVAAAFPARRESSTLSFTTLSLAHISLLRAARQREVRP